jgi:hypothetical protein
MLRTIACSSMLITLATFLASPLPASGSSAIVIDRFTGQLWDLDLANGQYSNPRETGLTYPGAVRFNSYGQLYALTNSHIYRVNPTTGASTSVNPFFYLGFEAFNGTGLAWDASTNTMFGSQLLIDDSTVVRHLLKINLGTGYASIVGNYFISQHVADLSFDELGNLWLLHLGLEQYGWTDHLYQVDKLTGRIIGTFSLSMNLSGTAGMGFDPATRTMYVVNGGGFGKPAELYSINLTSGVLTLIGSGTGPITPSGLAIVPLQGDFNGDVKVDGADYVTWRKSGGTQQEYERWRANFGRTAASGSSFNSAVPEPSTYLLLGMAAISLLGYRKSRSHGEPSTTSSRKQSPPAAQLSTFARRMWDQ